MSMHSASTSIRDVVTRLKLYRAVNLTEIIHSASFSNISQKVPAIQTQAHDHLTERSPILSNKKDDEGTSNGRDKENCNVKIKNSYAFDCKPERTRNAAVLISLFSDEDGEVRVWLTKRASKLSSHSGEVALPGGKRDKEDVDDISTALREAQEEIGLLPSQIEIITKLEPCLSKHLLTVVPVIGIVRHGEEFTPRPNQSEVESVFSAPLKMFLMEENHSFKDTEWLDFPLRIHYFEHNFIGQNFTIWGLTASILIRTARIVFGKEPDFLEFHPKVQSYDEILADFAKKDLFHL